MITRRLLANQLVKLWNIEKHAATDSDECAGQAVFAGSALSPTSLVCCSEWNTRRLELLGLVNRD
jgi:hypothetical protein